MLPTSYQQFIHLSRYARWDDTVGRRETWEETVQRYFDFFLPYLGEHHGLEIQPSEIVELQSGITNLQVMPSMRCLMTAGTALSRDHLAGYNCAYRTISDIRAFDEILFILMCSTGVGFSVERQYVNQLSAVPERLDESAIELVVRDSKRGWAEAFRELLGLLYAGRIPRWDMSLVREKGSRLYTMGGTASGPEPLVELFEFTIRLFQGAVGRKLSSQECHDLVCMIGECVVVGGVRRSALLSLSNLSDHRMRDAKSGDWTKLTPWRYIANNSVAYTEKPTVGDFMTEWQALYNSKSGERGFFNREAAREQAMRSGRRKGYYANGVGQIPIEFGTNPCAEILLRPEELCNLSTTIMRAEDTVETMADKIRLAAILGTWQSCLTKFRYITKAWQANCEEERLLGVSMTGIMGNPILAARTEADWKRLPDVLEYLKGVGVDTNREWAERLGIPQSVAVTCIKPEGTATQQAGIDESGIHPAHSPFYIRRVRENKDGPVGRMLEHNGFMCEVDVANSQNLVFSFPRKAPKTSVFRDDITAIEQLEHSKVFQDHWCEHKVSLTVYAREHEWPSLGGWVYDNFDSMSGVSFLPYSDHGYKQAPFEEITGNVYNVMMSKMPGEFDMAEELANYENEDHTTGGRELACVAGACEI